MVLLLGYIQRMSVEIKLIGQADPLVWRDDAPARPEFRTYGYRVLDSGVVEVHVTRHVVDEHGFDTFSEPVPEVFYGASAWEQVTDGTAV